MVIFDNISNVDYESACKDLRVKNRDLRFKIGKLNSRIEKLGLEIEELKHKLYQLYINNLRSKNHMKLPVNLEVHMKVRKKIPTYEYFKEHILKELIDE